MNDKLFPNDLRYQPLDKIEEQITVIGDSIENSGAKTDGTNALPSIINTIKKSNDVIVPSGSFTIHDELSISKPVNIIGKKGSQIINTNTNSNGDVKINSNDVTLRELDITGKSIIQGIYMSAVERIKLIKNKITSAKHGIHINSSNIKDVDIINNDINATNFGVLTNQNAKNGKNLNILFNKIYSSTADAVELNNPTEKTGLDSDSFKQVKIIGNTLTSDVNGTGPTAGFAIGIANTRDVVVIGNITEVSRNEALHIEDDQENIIVIGNVFNGCVNDGSRIIPMAGAKMPIVSSNNFIKKGLTKTGVGIWRVYDSNGSLEVNVSNNYVRGFDVGLWMDGKSWANVEGTVVEDCNVALKTGKSSRILGNLISVNSPILIQASSGSIIEEITSLIYPDKIIDYIGSTGDVGATLHKLKATSGIVSIAAGETNIIDLFPLGNIVRGSLYVAIDGGSKLMFECGVSWDGENLIVSDMIQRSSGVFGSTINVINNNGRLSFTVYCSSYQSAIFKYSFSGIYYKEN